MNNQPKKIILVGGGFAGINFIKPLAKDNRFEITLVDRNNYHFFPPLLYQVGTAFIEPSNISYPFRRLFQEKHNLRFHMGTLLKVNMESNTIETSSGILPYDYLVLAVGTESNFFEMDNVKKNTLPLKTINDATNLRNHLLINMEKAVQAASLEERERLLTVVIAGGGPTGVEVTGMLAEMARHLAPREYPEITNLKYPIYLVEAASVLLGTMSTKAQSEAYGVLTKLGVNILLNTAVKDYINGQVFLSNGTTIPTSTLIWTSGVIGRVVPGIPLSNIGRGRRILVDDYFKVRGTNNIFAIGDIALLTVDQRYADGHPQLAQVALQQGKALALNFKRIASQKILVPFKFRNKGSMAIISKYKAVADLPFFSCKGLFAWIVWLFVHIIPIASYRNKITLSFNWLWSFITNNPTLRLVIRPKNGE